MVKGIDRLVIWAHSECRSTAALFSEAARQTAALGIDVRFCLWGMRPLPAERTMPLPEAVRVGEDFDKGMSVLRESGGARTVHVFCVYQNSAVWRRLIVAAKRSGARVVVNAEAPCEMCLGLRAWLKRLYYRWVLPWRVRSAVKAADLFISSSGTSGMDRLERLGWKREKIVPFGYASPRLEAAQGQLVPASGTALRVLHLGGEAAYRGVRIAEKAVKLSGAELTKTGGRMGESELVEAIRRADVVVACGLCEPWGMRVNDALLEGTPVVVSDGMGAADVCDWYGCGCAVPKGDAKALAAVLTRCSEDRGFLAKLRAGAETAARELRPERRAGEWLRHVLGQEDIGRAGG